MTIENIIFDLGGVLLNLDIDNTRKEFEQLGLSNFDEIYTFEKQNKFFDQLETGCISDEEFFDAIREYIPTANNDQITNAWNAMLLDLPKKRVTMLRNLSKRFNLYLLSNTNSIHERGFIEIITDSYYTDLFEGLFMKQFYSHSIGYRKPNKDCFQYVLSLCNLNPKTTLFIDDNMGHIEGAKRLGINVIWLEEGNEITEVLPNFLAQFN